MKKFLLFAAISVVFISCQSSSPKETAQKFIKAIYTADFTTASTLTSTDTKTVMDKAKQPTTPVQTPDEIFQLAALTETVNGERAEVKNEFVQLSLLKEKEGWKVVLNEKLLNDIQGREEQLSQVKAKWEALLKEYEARVKLAKEYINYKKSIASLSPQARALESELAGFTPQKEWTKETLLAYVQKQQQLSKAIDEALEPSMAANTDLTMNYFLQISNAGDRVEYAEGDYQTIAEKALSPVYVALPFKATNSLKVNEN